MSDEKMTDERVYLDVYQAIDMLDWHDDRVHTIRQAGFALIGADWDRSDVIECLNKNVPELSGEQATAMHHGVVCKDEHGYVFFATK